MSKLTTENIELLDRVYNLRGSNSTILVELERQMDDSASEYEENSGIRQNLEDTINNLNNDVEVLSDQGERLKNVLNGINEYDYSKLLETLNIDFRPSDVKDKLDTLLPVTINGLVSDIKMSSNELFRVQDKLEETKTRIEELNLRKEEALVNQDRLNRYFDLALSSNINVTREELTSLFAQLGFSEDESRECAKLLMFPEDGLFEYEKEYKDVPRTHVVEESVIEEEPVVEESKDYSDDFVIEDIAIDNSPITFIDAEEVEKAESIEEVEQTEEKPIIEEVAPTELVEETPIIEEVEEPINTDYIIEQVDVSVPEEEVQEVVEKPSKDEVVSYLTGLGFDALDFTSNDIEKIIDNYNKEQIEENVNTVRELGINTDVFFDNIELLYDKEMKEKIDKLTSVGKLPQDIYLNPSVLTKYNLLELDSAIKTLEDSGLEPKNVPLMAY